MWIYLQLAYAAGVVLHWKGWGMRKREGFSHYAKSNPISSTVNKFINQNEDPYGVF